MIEPISASAGPLIAKVAAELAAPAKGLATRAKEKLEIKFRKGFENYIEKQVERAATIKTIVSSSTPIPLRSIYVNLFLQNGRTALRDDDFTNATEFKKIIFTATAGAGKSMLMRYLFTRFLEVQLDHLPVFIELRDLNQRPESTLMTLVREKIGAYIDGFSDQHLKFAFQTGKIALFLDGFDEIDHDTRKSREKELNEISSIYDNLLIFISSRPTETFANWEKFHVFNVQPFTKKQVELLISKIPYDEEIKSLFVKKLEQGLYETHKEFLTNPLLTIMMLVTLEQFAEIPAKIHLFYEYAFEALFGRHDVTKGGFQRKRHTTLALDDFKRLFSYFCMITYIKKSTTFSSDAVLGFIQQSIASSQIVIDKTSFRNDLTESTCMLVMDGLDYTFSHRSFQEYFAAYFLARVKADEIERVVPKLVEINGAFDSVIKMLSEMNNEKFEEVWSLPTITSMVKSIDGIDASKNPIALCRAVLGDPILHVYAGTEIRVTAGSNQRQLERYTLYGIYDLFSQIHARLKDKKNLDSTFLKRVRAGELLGADARFEAIRKMSPKQPQPKPIDIPLVDTDDAWFKDTFFGKFLHQEADLLPKLRTEIADRVNARKKGLTTIFS